MHSRLTDRLGGKEAWRGVQPTFHTTRFFCIFPLCYGYLRFDWKMQKKKSGIMKSGLDAMPLFLLDDLLINN